jgi:CDK inhibitor PHO81
MQEFDFMVADMDAFSVQFDVYPMFGTKSIGRAIALPSIFKILSASSWSGAGEYETCICPLFDSHLNVVGEVEFV